MMVLFVCLIASCAVALYVLSPLFAVSSTSTEAVNTEGLQGLLDQKTRCVQILKDLELDYSTQKVSEVDYATMRAGTTQELATILQHIDASESQTKG